MAKKVLEVTVPNLSSPLYWVTYQLDDGSQTCHVFPWDTLHWRSAEYGIDPTDSNLLLHIVLHEPHIDTSSDNPEFLYNVRDRNRSLSEHLRKIEEVRDKVGIADPKGHLDKIHQHHATTHNIAMHKERCALVDDLLHGTKDASKR